MSDYFALRYPATSTKQRRRRMTFRMALLLVVHDLQYVTFLVADEQG
jgi:hypothetical protein